jgi:hypothetical protein
MVERVDKTILGVNVPRVQGEVLPGVSKGEDEVRPYAAVLPRCSGTLPGV